MRERERSFIADAAHELRTPLTALQLQLQVAERAGDATARAAALGALREGLERASRLVEQLLALARTEPRIEPTQDRASTSMEPTAARADADQRVDLIGLARASIAAHAHLALDRGIDLGMEPSAPKGEEFAAEDRPSIEVAGDRDALFTLLGNLIDNALRYTPRGGRVDVAVEIEDRANDAGDDGAIVLSVSDDGPGIAPHERERVFDRFHRGEGARAAGDTRGSGLGLAIVKRIAERHGASIVLGETANGMGLTVTVRFPSPA